MTLAELIRMAREDECSDLHLTAGTAVAVRRYGVLKILEDISPSLEDMEKMIFSLLDDQDIKKIKSGIDVDVATTDTEGARIRMNVYRQRNNVAASIRLLDPEIPTLDQLGFSKVAKDFAERRSGLVLVTGPTGSGKSTTLAAMLNHINHTLARHIITVEDPIEYVYPHDKAMIHQRQIGKDVSDFATALRSCLREDPDVIMVGEMRDFETINAAVTAAETGHLVLSTLHTKSAAQTVERIINACPIEIQGTMQVQLASVLTGVITQELLPLIDGSGRAAATEIMINTPAIGNLIRENKPMQIQTVIQSNQNIGMHTMNHSLAELVHTRKVTRMEAFKYTESEAELKRMI